MDVKWGGDAWFGTYALALQSGQSPETLVEHKGGGLPFTRPDGTTANVGVILDGVRSDGQPNTQVVHYYYKYLNAGGWGRANTAPAVRENTWVKCREITLAYQLPNRLAARTHVFSGPDFGFDWPRPVLFLHNRARQHQPRRQHRGGQRARLGVRLAAGDANVRREPLDGAKFLNKKSLKKEGQGSSTKKTVLFFCAAYQLFRRKIASKSA